MDRIHGGLGEHRIASQYLDGPDASIGSNYNFHLDHTFEVGSLGDPRISGATFSTVLRSGRICARTGANDT